MCCENTYLLLVRSILRLFIEESTGKIREERSRNIFPVIYNQLSTAPPRVLRIPHLPRLGITFRIGD